MSIQVQPCLGIEQLVYGAALQKQFILDLALRQGSPYEHVYGTFAMHCDGVACISICDGVA